MLDYRTLRPAGRQAAFSKTSSQHSNAHMYDLVCNSFHNFSHCVVSIFAEAGAHLYSSYMASSASM